MNIEPSIASMPRFPHQRSERLSCVPSSSAETSRTRWLTALSWLRVASCELRVVLPVASCRLPDLYGQLATGNGQRSRNSQLATRNSYRGLALLAHQVIPQLLLRWQEPEDQHDAAEHEADQEPPGEEDRPP